MFQNLIRRISHSILPRPDRPWADDATSNAPQKRKRRLSTSEQDSDGENSKKKIRSVTSTPVDESKPIFPQPETKEVKEVTAGVNEVDLEDKPVTAIAPEAVPLPEAESNELEELAPSSDSPEATKPDEQGELTTSITDATAPEVATADSEDSSEEASTQKDVATDKSEDTPAPTTTTTEPVIPEEPPAASTTTGDEAQPNGEDTPSKTAEPSSPKKD